MDVEYKGKDTIIHNLKDFDLGQTMECGQCFHFQKIDDDEYGMSAYGKFLHAAQKDDKMYLFDTTKEEFEKKIKDKYPEFTIDYNDENCIKVIEYTQGDRVKTIKIGNLELSGVEVRSLLALRSANFTTQISENEIKFTVKGYGHGVGMSQTGADSMAKQGSNYEEIIKHYYTGVEITNL